jgi:hypothetical protein
VDSAPGNCSGSLSAKNTTQQSTPATGRDVQSLRASDRAGQIALDGTEDLSLITNVEADARSLVELYRQR